MHPRCDHARRRRARLSVPDVNLQLEVIRVLLALRALTRLIWLCAAVCIVVAAASVAVVISGLRSVTRLT